MAVLLVTNDDGVHAAGLAALASALADLGEVHVLAPEREQSACGHALTLHRPLRVQPLRERWHAVNGTPSDCVNIGILGFLPERPALIVSGINHGSNLGDDVTYSGTVSAAMEGTLLGVPSIAVSLGDDGVSLSPVPLDPPHHRALAHLTAWAGPLSSQPRRASRRAP